MRFFQPPGSNILELNSPAQQHQNSDFQWNILGGFFGQKGAVLLNVWAVELAGILQASDIFIKS